MALRKNLAKNAIATGFQKFVRFGELLLLVPLYLRLWGPEYYGEWLTITAIPTIFALSDLGIGSAGANAFVLKYAGGEKADACAILKCTLILIALISVAISAILVAILAFLDQAAILEALSIPAAEIWIAVLILIISRLVSFFNQPFEAFFRAARRAAFGINLLAVKGAVRICLFAIVLVSGGRIVAIAIADLCVSLLFTGAFALIAFRILPDVSLRGVGSRWKLHVSQTFRVGLAYLLIPAWQAILFQGTTIAVRVTLGPESVALFNTLRSACRAVNQLFSTINGTVFPELQFEYAAGRLETVRRLFRISLVISITSATAASVFMLIFGPFLYNFWTDGLFDVSRSIWTVFLVGVILNAGWWTAGIVFRAANKPQGPAVVGLIASIVSVGITFILAAHFGIIGAALGTVAFEAIMLVYITATASSIIGQRVGNLGKNLGDDSLAIWSMTKSLRNRIPLLKG